VLHEDESLIVLDKPAGAVVHPGPEHHGGDTLLDLLRAHLPEAFAKGSEYRPAFVHRLDRGTSGVLAAAKTRAAAHALEGALRRGEARKVYLALVAGVPRRQEGRIDVPLVRATTARGVTRVRALRGAAPGGPTPEETHPAKAATTRYRVERVFPGHPGAALLSVEISTGRTHQIRVHLSSIGHPVVGDGDYGDKRVNRRFREEWGVTRVLLHSSELELPHPATGTRTRFAAPLPADFRRVLAGLGGRERSARGEELLNHARARGAGGRRPRKGPRGR
jgi:23S rRNA pseudouridine1911/1915/1917 synthase